MSTTTQPAIAGAVEIRPASATPATLAERVYGRELAEQVEEYFELGTRVERGDVVLDAGANVGAFAAAVAQRTGGDVTIHCFEPAAPIFGELERSFASHGELGAMRYELHPIALTSPELHGTERTFHYFRHFPADSTYDLERKLSEFALYFAKKGSDIEHALGRWGRPWRWLGGAIRTLLAWLCRRENPLGVWLALRMTGMQAMPCRLASVERVLEARGIERVDLLKIDVEGAELDVLRGCGAAWPKIRRVAVETDARDGMAAEVIALLEREGLRIRVCTPPSIANRGDAGQLLVIAEREACRAGRATSGGASAAG